MPTQTLSFTDSSALKGREGKYRAVQVNASAVIKSWKLSLFSFEWLTPEGAIRPLNELPMREREKRMAVEQMLKSGKTLERPVLGIGLMENVEIGSGKDIFLTLAAAGHDRIPVHIPISCEDEFRKFIVS